MITIVSNLFTNAFRSVLAASLFAAAIGCSDPEQFVEPAAKPEAEVVEPVATAQGEAASLTVSGAFIEYSDSSLCNECTYVIPEDATIVDGEKVGIKAGDVVCLNSSFKYGAIELVNVEGTESEPVVVATCNE